MSVKGAAIGRWIEQIFATEADEISCSECLDLSSQCVDEEIEGKQGKALEQVKQHLLQCRACREEYETLLDLARMERNSHAPP